MLVCAVRKTHHPLLTRWCGVCASGGAARIWCDCALVAFVCKGTSVVVPSGRCRATGRTRA